MPLGMNGFFRRVAAALAIGCALFGAINPASAQGIVPGSGTKLANVGDDFEDEKWSYTFNNPKASSNIDHIDRQPGGGSTNGRWVESMYRGHPDIIQRVPTPPGGNPNSKGAMLMQTRLSGVPGLLSGKDQQDDLLANVSTITGSLHASRGPSAVVRVYVPAFEEWEKRTGSSFGFRLDCQTTIYKSSPSKFFKLGRSGPQTEAYWPGIFIQLMSKHDGVNKEDSAHFLIRSDEYGHDLPGPKIKPATWYTLGISVSPDGGVHYYIREGVEALRPTDRITSQYPYGYHAEFVHTFFFNVVNWDDGRSWSTKWIVDDCEVFTLR